MHRAVKCIKNIKHSIEVGTKEVWAISQIFNFYIHIDLSRRLFLLDLRKHYYKQPS